MLKFDVKFVFDVNIFDAKFDVTVFDVSRVDVTVSMLTFSKSILP